MIMNKRFLTIFFSILFIALSLGFSQSIAKAVAAKPTGWSYISGNWCYLDAKGTKMTNKWAQDKSLKWFYLKADGTMAVNKWAQDSSKKWFYLGSDGSMQTNKWYQDSSKKWFYVGSDGAMKTSSWISYKDKWYYVNTDGSMAVNSLTPDGYTVDSAGAWDGKPAATKPVTLDTTAPVITLKGYTTVSINTGTVYTDVGATIKDNVDTSLNPIVTITDAAGRFYSSIDTTKACTFTITYNAVDAAGNKATPIVRTIIVTGADIVDTVPPVITLKGYATMSVKNGIIYTDAGATAADNVDLSINPTTIITDASGNKLTKINTTKAGTYKITYNAVDTAGNIAVPVIRTVIVKEVGAPITFAIDIGHNAAYDGGAVGIRAENDCTKEVGTKVMQKLTALGYGVVNCAPTAPTSTTDSLKQRCDIANAAGADYFVSVHFNIGGGQGTEIYYISDTGKALASNILPEIAALGYTNRGVKLNTTYYVLKNTNEPAILIECAFLDSVNDMNLYNADAIAGAIVKGLTKQP